MPFTVMASKNEFDFCGIAPDLVYDIEERQAGWENGDIGYSNGWFALFHDGQECPSSYTTEMIIGHIDDHYLNTLREMADSIEIKVILS